MNERASATAPSLSAFFPAYHDWGTIASQVLLVSRVLRELTNDWEVIVVNGFKIARSDPIDRIVVGRLYHWLVKIAFGPEAKHVDCDFRLIRRGVFDAFRLTRDTGLICLELVTKIEKCGFRSRHVPVHHYHRLHGRSQFFNFRWVAQVALGLGRLWWELIPRRRIRA